MDMDMDMDMGKDKDKDKDGQVPMQCNAHVRVVHSTVFTVTEKGNVSFARARIPYIQCMQYLSCL